MDEMVFDRSGVWGTRIGYFGVSPERYQRWLREGVKVTERWTGVGHPDWPQDSIMDTPITVTPNPAHQYVAGGRFIQPKRPLSWNYA